jgi:hypothetical protein
MGRYADLHNYLFGMRMPFKPVIVVPIGLSVAAISLTLLCQHVDSIVGNFPNPGPCLPSTLAAISYKHNEL